MEGDASELKIFHRYISQRLADGSELTPEECLFAWRMENPAADDLEDSVAAVNRALEQLRRGEGKTVDEFDREFRARHNIPGVPDSR